MDLGVQEGLLRSIYAAHNGVYRMSADMEDLVETSNNIARVIVKDGEISIQNLTRSSVETSKIDLANALRSAYELFGCEVTFGGSYPGWTPNVKSEILDVLDTYLRKTKRRKTKSCSLSRRFGMWDFRNKLSRYGYDFFRTNHSRSAFSRRKSFD